MKTLNLGRVVGKDGLTTAISIDGTKYEQVDGVITLPSGGGSGGTTDHNALTNRNNADQHEMGAITGLTTALDAKADKTELPDVSGLATKTEVTDGLATKQDTLTAGSNITIVDNVISATGGGSGGTTDHNALTNRDMDNQHPISAITDLETALDAKANKTELPDVSGLATKTELDEKADTTTVNTALDLKADKTELDNKQDKLVAGTNITIDESTNTISAIGGGSGGTANHNELANRNNADQHEMGAITGLTTALDTKADKTEIPSIDGLATTDSVNTALDLKADKTELPDVSGLATKTEVTDGLALKADTTTVNTALDLKADKTEIPSIDGLATKTEVTDGLATKQDTLTAGSNITITDGVISSTGGGSGGTTDHNALTNRDMADQHEMGAITGLTTALDNKQDTLTAGSNITIVDNVISSTGGSGGSSNAVLYTPQTLTEEQKAQARSNIGVKESTEETIVVPDLILNDITWELGTLSYTDGTPIGSSTRSRTVELVKIREQGELMYSKIIAPENVRFSLRFYNGSSFVAGDSVWSDSNIYDLENRLYDLPTCNNIKFVVKKVDETVITSEDLTLFTTISMEGKTITIGGDTPSTPSTEQVQRELHPNKSLILKCAYETNWTESPNNATMFIWHDHEFNFYKSYGADSYKEFIFKWDHTTEPKYYAMAVVNDGDLLAVFRTEHLTTVQSTDIRENPLFFRKEQNYEMSELNFGNNTKPSAWIANQGFTRDSVNGTYYMVEYTRPSVEKAYAWKINGDPSKVYNWSIIQEQTLSGQLNSGMKHYHSTQVDPYTGFVYLCTGDDDTAAYQYVTKDEGATIEVVYGPNEKYCRLLNWIFLKDHVYWATDSGLNGKHSLFRATRNAEGVIDVANAEILYDFPFLPASVATYASVYMEALNCIVFLERADAGSEEEIPFYIWDLEDNTMKQAQATPSRSSNGGYRCEFYQLFPKDNKIMVGFGYSSFGASNNTNRNYLLGNSTLFSGGICNMVITVNRVGNGFRNSFDTVK